MPCSKGNRSSPPRPFDVIGLITMLLTVSAAVLLYMGWAFLDGYLKTFNVNATHMGFGADEYILYGIKIFSPIFLPWMVAIPLLLSAAARRAELSQLLPERARRAGRHLMGRRPVQVVTNVRFIGAVVTLAGLVIAVTALTKWQTNTYLLLAPAIVGPLMLTWPSRDERNNRLPFAASVVISTFCLLWAVAVYAQERGRQDAQEFLDSLPHKTQVAIFSKDSLAINAPGVTSRPISSGKYRHLYTGLRLLLIRNDRYYLLPVVTKKQQKNGEGRTFVLTEEDGLRLELLPGTRTPDAE